MSKTLPDIPEKRYFSIGEVAHLCAVKPHVLRYWEQEFTVIKPVKRRGSRRYYQLKDVTLIRHIRHLLYDKGFTITGAKRELKLAVTPEENADDNVSGIHLNAVIDGLKNLIAELETV